MKSEDATTTMGYMGMPSWLIGQASVHSHKLLSDGFASADSRGYHYRLLAALAELGPASQAELGRRTGIDRSDVVAALNDLADRGMVERTPDPDDRRRNIVTITPAGTTQFHRLNTILADTQDKFLAPLTSAERELFIQFLTRINTHHTEIAK